MKTGSMVLKRFAAIAGIVVGGIGAGGSISPANALTFNFTPASGMSQQAIDGFATAGGLWSSLFSDNVTINIDIDFTALGSGILGQAGSTDQDYSYNLVRNALNADKLSTDDINAVNSLTTNSAFKMLWDRIKCL